MELNLTPGAAYQAIYDGVRQAFADALAPESLRQAIAEGVSLAVADWINRPETNGAQPVHISDILRNMDFSKLEQRVMSHAYGQVMNTGSMTGRLRVDKPEPQEIPRRRHDDKKE